ncbi:uncharacterized protein LOC143653441 [Tamandua tetradactyla]|uniref:uncharacterized protein LOC143653441 n=1 Tax=Tamandua tetradactyla TaxID=48850 RepID=UPI0040543A61
MGVDAASSCRRDTSGEEIAPTQLCAPGLAAPPFRPDPRCPKQSQAGGCQPFLEAGGDASTTGARPQPPSSDRPTQGAVLLEEEVGAPGELYPKKDTGDLNPLSCGGNPLVKGTFQDGVLAGSPGLPAAFCGGVPPRAAEEAAGSSGLSVRPSWPLALQQPRLGWAVPEGRSDLLGNGHQPHDNVERQPGKLRRRRKPLVLGVLERAPCREHLPRMARARPMVTPGFPGWGWVQTLLAPARCPTSGQWKCCPPIGWKQAPMDQTLAEHLAFLQALNFLENGLLQRKALRR